MEWIDKAKNKDGKFECKYCGKQLNSKYNLEQHLKLHSENRPAFLCAECSKTYTSKNTLQVHISAMHEGKMCKCIHSGCIKQFVTKGQWKNHLRKHEGNFKFQCEICDEGFLHKDVLNVHMNRH